MKRFTVQKLNLPFLQCVAPELSPQTTAVYTEHYEEQSVTALLLSDTHLLCLSSNWFERTRRDHQMLQTFRTAMELHKPDVVFVLGDLTKEGQFWDDDMFNDCAQSFKRLFAVPETVKLHLAVGNHDIGFHYKYVVK